MTSPAVWQMIVGGINATGAPEHPLLRGDHTWTRRINRPDSVSFAYDARDPSVPTLAARLNDLWVYRQGPVDVGLDLLSRLRVWTVQRTIDDTHHRVEVTAVDYSGILEAVRKVWPTSTLAWTATDQADIAWDLIADSQALTNGSLGITRGRGFTAGAGNTGIDRDETVQPGDSIGKLISAIGARDNGYDWDIDAALALNIDHPQRGTTKTFGLVYGANVQRVVERVAAVDYANAGIVSGSSGLSIVTATAAGIAADPAGRWEREWSFPSVVIQQTIADRAPWLVDDSTRPPGRYQVQLRQGMWEGPDQLDAGDTTTLTVVDGVLALDGVDVRVLQLSVRVSTSGAETVTLDVEEVAP